MSQKPKLAIVGRPNVGKSALFNRISKKRIAIVDEAEGVTRDRIYADAECFSKSFTVIDTGGIDPRSTAPYNELIKRQAEIAIEEADTIVMVVDGRAGVTDLDAEVAKVLLRTAKPLALAVNKIDNPDEENRIHDFHVLGIERIIATSAAQGANIAELLEAALESFSANDTCEEESQGIKVAIIGRPNVGKSSLINTLLKEERCIVSPIPGTTRDSIDTLVEHDGTPYTFIDTAGIRRKHAEKEAVDKFSAIRTERSIERADICLLMVDAQQGLTTQEKRIATAIEEAGKGCIVLFNKWDLVKGFRMEHCLKEVEEEVPFLKHCPKLMISALTGRNVDKIFAHIQECSTASTTRISTGELNKFIEAAIQRNHPPMIQGRRLRIYYMTQVGIEPPRFVMFVNRPELMAESYLRYLHNRLRDVYPFTGVPVLFKLKAKASEQAKAD